VKLKRAIRRDGMGSTEENGETNPEGPVRRNPRVRRSLIYAVVLPVVFLLGLVPMWVRARWHAAERERARASLRISTLQNTLANAARDARSRGARRRPDAAV
jgi:hypothetical protein